MASWVGLVTTWLVEWQGLSVVLSVRPVSFVVELSVAELSLVVLACPAPSLSSYLVHLPSKQSDL